MRAGEICHWPLFHCLLTLSLPLLYRLLFYYSIFSEIYFWNYVYMCENEDVWRCWWEWKGEGGQCLTSFLHPLIRKIFAHTFSSLFFSLFFITDKHNYNNEMTRQFPVMQLQSFNYPKNVSMLSSPSLTTSSLINNNSLLTFRDIMMQQQQYQLHQQQMLQQEHHRTIKNENENCIQSSSSISLTNALSSSSLSPNTLSTSSTKLSPKHHQQYHSQSLVTAAATAEKHERAHHALSIKLETGASSVENGSKINNSANRFNKAETYHHHHQNNQSSSGGGSGRTVREELEASRCKIPKLGEFLNLIE